jgi:hypothetical protein
MKDTPENRHKAEISMAMFGVVLVRNGEVMQPSEARWFLESLSKKEKQNVYKGRIAVV